MSDKKPVSGSGLVNDLGLPIKGVVPQDRIIERKMGCWNCSHMDTGEGYLARVRERMEIDRPIIRARHLRRLLELGMPAADAEAKAELLAAKTVETTRGLLTNQAGHLGICTIDKNVNESGQLDHFTSAKHLCTSWSGLPGVLGSFAPGEAADPLVEEIKERLDGPKAS